LTKENDKEKKKEKLFNVLLILVSLFLFIGSLYLIYCISRNLPYDLVCAKIDIVKNAEKNSEEKSESSEKNNEATTNDQDVEDEEYDDQENLEDNKASADD
jgi:flagellar basal body-associated protein FliL